MSPGLARVSHNFKPLKTKNDRVKKRFESIVIIDTDGIRRAALRSMLFE